MTPTPPDRSVEAIAKQLHGWYLEATKELNPENYNAKAQVAYDDMNEEQKEIDRYIARKVLSLQTQGIEAGRRERDTQVQDVVRALDECIECCALVNGTDYCKNCGLEKEMYATLKHPNE